MSGFRNRAVRKLVGRIREHLETHKQQTRLQISRVLEVEAYRVRYALETMCDAGVVLKEEGRSPAGRRCFLFSLPKATPDLVYEEGAFRAETPLRDRLLARLAKGPASRPAIINAFPEEERALADALLWGLFFEGVVLRDKLASPILWSLKEGCAFQEGGQQVAASTKEATEAVADLVKATLDLDLVSRQSPTERVLEVAIHLALDPGLDAVHRVESLKVAQQLAQDLTAE